MKKIRKIMLLSMILTGSQNVFAFNMTTMCDGLINNFNIIKNPLGENVKEYIDVFAANNLVNNDRLAVRCAIENAVKSGGSKKVIFPAGEYDFSNMPVATVLLGSKYSGLTLEGVGHNSVIKHNSGEYAFKFGDSDKNNGVRRVKIKNLRIDSDSNEAGIKGGIHFGSYSTNSLIEGIRINGRYAYERDGNSCISYFENHVHTIKDSLIYYCDTAIKGGDQDGHFNAANIISNEISHAKNAILLRSSVTTNIKNNTFQGVIKESVIKCAGKCRALNIDGNYFETGFDENTNAIEIASLNNQAISINNNSFQMGTVRNNVEYKPNENILIRQVSGLSILGNVFMKKPASGGTYIKLGINGSGTNNFDNYVTNKINIQNNSDYTDTGNNVYDYWQDVSFIRFADSIKDDVNLNSLDESVINFKSGIIYDNKYDRIIFGKYNEYLIRDDKQVDFVNTIGSPVIN